MSAESQRPESAESRRPQRVDLGFTGGQVLALRMDQTVYEGLRTALEASESDGWHELRAEDSQVAVDLSKVVYVRLDTEQHKVGF